MRIRFVRQYKGYAKGAVIEPGPAVANIFIRRGFAVPMDIAAIEAATAEPRAERAVQPAPIKRKRGRPRKELANV